MPPGAAASAAAPASVAAGPSGPASGLPGEPGRLHRPERRCGRLVLVHVPADEVVEELKLLAPDQRPVPLLHLVDVNDVALVRRGHDFLVVLRLVVALLL